MGLNNEQSNQNNLDPEKLKKELRDSVFSVDCKLINNLRNIPFEKGGISEDDVMAFARNLNPRLTADPKIYFAFEKEEDKEVLNKMSDEIHSGTNKASASELALNAALSSYLMNEKKMNESLIKVSEISNNKEISVIFASPIYLKDYIGESIDRNIPYININNIIGEGNEQEGYSKLYIPRQITTEGGRKYNLDYFFSYLRFPSNFLFLYDNYILTSYLKRHIITFQVPRNKYLKPESKELIEEELNCSFKLYKKEIEIIINDEDLDSSTDFDSVKDEAMLRIVTLLGSNQDEVTNYKYRNYNAPCYLGQREDSIQKKEININKHAFDNLNKRISVWISWLNNHKNENNKIYFLTKTNLSDNQFKEVFMIYLKELGNVIEILEKKLKKDKKEEIKLESLKLIKKFFEGDYIRIIPKDLFNQEKSLNKKNLHDRIYFNDHASVTWGKGFDIFEQPKEYQQKSLRVAHDSNISVDSIFSYLYRDKKRNKDVWPKTILARRYADLRELFEISKL